MNVVQSSLSDHLLGLIIKGVRLDVAKFWLSNRIVNELNILGQVIVLGNLLLRLRRIQDCL